MPKTEKKHLGRGLDAIFGVDVNSVLEEIQNGADLVPNTKSAVKLSEIRTNPYQPRITFDETKLEELRDSILAHGVFTPVLVKKALQGYELVAGERRVRASKMAGLVEIPAIIVEFSDEQMMEIALLENIQRENLSVIEEAQGYSKLMERLDYTQEQLAKRVGKSREHVANTTRLLKLPPQIQQMVIDNQLSMGHARALLTLEKAQALTLANKIIKEALSVRAAEKLVQELDLPKQTKLVRPQKQESDYSYAQQLMKDRLQTKVSIHNQQIVIYFQDDAELNELLEKMQMIEE